MDKDVIIKAMQLNFNTLFNILASLVVKIQNNAVVKKHEDKEMHEILVTSIELAISGSDDEDFDNFLRFLLLYKDKDSNKVFDADCFIRKKKDGLVQEGFADMQDDFVNTKYRLVLEKSVSVLLQDMFYNMKSMFYDTKEQEILFEFLNELVNNQTFPIIREGARYQIDDSLFTEDRQKELDLFYLIFINRNKNTLRTIKDNTERYNVPAREKEIADIKEFETCSKEQMLSKSKLGGKNRFNQKITDNKGKRIESPLEYLDLDKKEDVVFQAGYLKKYLFRQMYLNYLLRPHKISRRARAEHIYNIILLLKEIKDNTKKNLKHL